MAKEISFASKQPIFSGHVDERIAGHKTLLSL